MPQALLQPGVYIEEIPSGVRTITGVATSIALFIGWAPRGPITRALRLTSFADYERFYGGLDRRSLLGYSVRHFFDNGGSDAYVIRIASADPADPAETASCDIGDLHIPASSPGEWAGAFSVRLTHRTDPSNDPAVTSRFRLEVIVPATSSTKEVVLESFENLSMDPADPRFAPAVVNRRSVFMDDLTAGSTAAPGDDTQPFDGGKDGKVIGPADTDSEFRDAMLALFGQGSIADRIDLFNLVCVPGLTENTTIGSLQKACRDRRAFLIVDSVEDETVGNMASPTALNGITGTDAINAAIYYPWVKARDPLQNGALRKFPPCGFVAGIYARTDAARGVWKAPAGSEASLTGVAELALTMSEQENGQLNPLGINCLRTLPVFGNVVWGARTLQGNNSIASEWKYVPVRRMALFLEESLYRATQWVVFEPNDEPLWAQIRLNIGAFLQGLFRQGAFQGRTPREAYFVKCDRETNPQDQINLGIVNIFVGFAPLKPAEFVVIKIQQIAGEIQT
jgi:phage tail sheath protein FI